ncbi:metal-sensing transcriptional repressor [Mitsuokella multacida]|uniref:metal-sensing transcriptional repressor n=1 Tax=Mitsuokella multacida TaxID=52226 RepID=UPI0026669585|nr:metal-sensing transcriptional repressor [Mitsuokella multacida]
MCACEKTKNVAAAGTEDAEEKSCCGCVKHKYRDKDSKEYKCLVSRLRRIEGQVRGVCKMVEEDRYCVDILTQVSAIQSALNAFNKELLAQHIKSCVVDDIRAGHDEVVDELVATLQKVMK